MKKEEAEELVEELQASDKPHSNWTESRPWTVYTRAKTQKVRGEPDHPKVTLITELGYKGEPVHYLTGETGKRTLTDHAGHFNKIGYEPKMERSMKTRADGRIKN